MQWGGGVEGQSMLKSSVTIDQCINYNDLKYKRCGPHNITHKNNYMFEYSQNNHLFYFIGS